MMQQGVSIDFRKYLEVYAEYADLPELTEILQIGDPPEVPSPQGPSHGATGKPGNTERRYVRENVSQRDSQNTMNQVLSGMSGVNIGGAPNGNGTVGRPSSGGVY
jgi:hypothetical protein